MPVYPSCGGGGGGGGTTTTGGGGQSCADRADRVQPTNSQAATREQRPYAAEETSGGIDWWKMATEAATWAWEAFQDWVKEQLTSEENWQYATIPANLRQSWIGIYPINIIESEELDFSGKVTKYPIEGKDELADHMHNDPKKIRLKAWLGSPNPATALSGFTGQYLLDTSPFWAAKLLMIQLQKLQRDRTVVWYASALQVVPNMVVSRFRPMLRAPYGNALVAEIVLEQVKFGKAADVKEGEGVDDAGEPGNIGQQPPGGGTPTQEEKSLLERIVDAIARWLFGGGKAPEGE